MKAKHLLGVTLLLPLLLSACTDNSGPRGDVAGPIDTSVQPIKITDQYRGVEAFFDGPNYDSTGGPAIRWRDETRTAATLLTYGSGSCPNIPEKIQVLSTTKVTLMMKAYSEPCTADLSAYTTRFTMPDQVSRKQAVTVTLKTPGAADLKVVLNEVLKMPAASDSPSN